MRLPTVAIVGGGPAGAMTAAHLARTGRKVTLIDENLAWEKPCGGGITQKALELYPFLAEAEVERNWIRGCELSGPTGRRTWFPLNRQIAIFSRRVLNQLLLDRAADGGAKIIQDRVIAIEGLAGKWRIRGRSTSWEAQYVVIAGGARSGFRSQFTEPLASSDLMLTAGYFLPGTGEDIHIAFLPGLQGYIWIFPRRSHFSAGICARMQTTTAAALRKLLDGFLRRRGFDLSQASFYSHVLPAPAAKTFEQAALEGDGWALVGDAAGLVDPITGEGLYYALRSADLLAQALDKNVSYSQLLGEDFLPELALAARVADRFYRGSFLGKSVLDRVVQFTNAGPTIRELTRDLFAGTQGYRGLRRRFYLSFPRAIVQMLGSHSGQRPATD